MRQKTNLTEIKTLDTRSEAQKKIDAINADIPILIEVAKGSASVAFAQYSALTKQGFTPDQAMQIVLEQPAWK